MSWIRWMIYNHRQTTICIGVERLGIGRGTFLKGWGLVPHPFKRTMHLIFPWTTLHFA